MTIAVQSCPNCGAKDKVLARCRECLTLCCSFCCVTGACKDCFITLNSEYEAEDYFVQKFRDITSKPFRTVKTVFSLTLLTLFLIGCADGGGEVLSAPGSQNLTACYDFENNLSDSTNGYDFTNDSTTFTTGINGQGVVIGNESIVQESGIPVGTTEFSTSLWARRTVPLGDNEERGLFVRATCDTFRANPVELEYFTNSTFGDPTNSTLNVYMGDGSSQSYSLTAPYQPIPDSGWHHYVLRHYADQYEVWVDGSLVMNDTNSQTLADDTALPFVLGSDNIDYCANNHSSSEGSVMDEFALWQRAITPAEISSLYNSSNGVGCASFTAVPSGSCETPTTTAMGLLYLAIIAGGLLAALAIIDLIKKPGGR